MIGTAAAGTCFVTGSNAMSAASAMSKKSHEQCWGEHLWTKAPGQDLIPRLLREFHNIVKEGPSEESYKIFIQEPPKSISEELSYKHPQYRASSRSSRKDPSADFTRIFTLLTRTTRPWSRSSCQGFETDKILIEDLLERILQGPHTRTS